MVKGCFNWSGAKHLYQNSKGQLGCRSIALDLGQLGCRSIALDLGQLGSRSIALDLGQLGSRSIALTAKWTGVNKDIHFCAPPVNKSFTSIVNCV